MQPTKLKSSPLRNRHYPRITQLIQVITG